MNATPLSPGAADALLFDLGRVVLDIDFSRVLNSWAAHAGRDPSELIARFQQDDDYKRHERGEIDDETYFASLRRLLDVEISDEEFLIGWNATFLGPMPDIDELLTRAAAHLPLFAFSNTNRPHETFFTERYAHILVHFKRLFLSSSIGLRKPDAQAFDYVVQEIGVAAERIVFFDDLLENIEGAKARHIKTVHVISTRDIADALTALGI